MNIARSTFPATEYSDNDQKKGHQMVPFAIFWHRGAGLACVGSVSTFLSGDICPKPEVLGVRLVFVNVVVLLTFCCCVCCNGFIFFPRWDERCDFRHKMNPCNTC